MAPMRLAVAVITAVLTVVLSGCVSAPDAAKPTATGTRLPDSVRAKGELVIGSELSTPPLTFLDSDGTTVKGLNRDLALALGKELGVEVRFQQYGFEGLIPAVRTHKVDLAMDMVNDTKERRRLVDFVDYLQNSTTILLKKGNPERVDVLADLCGHSVALVRGSVQIPLVERQSRSCVAEGEKPIEIKQFAKPPDARLQVQTGRVTAFLGNTPVMLYLAENADDGKAFEAATTEQYGKEPVGIVFAKDQEQLRSAVLAALQRLWDDGTYHEILDDYGLRDLALDEPTVNGAAG